MTNHPRVRQLLDELLDSHATPEDVCRSCPEFLPEVRARWRAMCRVRADLDALFPAPTVRGVGAPAPRPESAALPQVPGHHAEAVLGHGGMGVVYRAWHLRLHRPVALKMLLAGAHAPSAERERLLREAEAVAGLSHPNIVQVYEVGDVDGRPYFTMEFVEGGSLAQRLAGTPQPADQAAALVATIAEAIQVAHQSGIVHRDLKPGNILLTKDGTPKVTDFGLARRLEGGGGLTLSGAPVGTPSYMAPEQARGDKGAIGPASDVYALGAILYECLTGRPPFRSETAAATLQQVLTEEPVPPARLNPRVPRDLQTICLKCLGKEPKRRYASAAALAEDLRRFERGEPITARPVGAAELLGIWVRRRPATAGMLAAGVLLVAAGAVGAWLLYQQRADARARQAETDREVCRVLEPARGLLEEGWRDADLAQVKQARSEADRAADIARTGGASAAVRHEAEAFREDANGRLERAEKDRALVEDVQDVSVPLEPFVYGQDTMSWPRVLDQPGADEQYAAAFRRWGLDVDGTPEAEVVARLSEQPGPVVQELIAGLDGWMLERRQLKRPEAEWRRLFRVADQLDSNERRRRLRALLVSGAPPRAEGVAWLVGAGSPWPALWESAHGNTWRALLELQRETDPRTEPVHTVLLLASACGAVGDVTGAERVLRQAVAARPEQVVLLHALGKLLERQGRSRLAEAIGYYRAARGRRPRLGLALSRALIVAGQADEADDVLRELVLLHAHDRNPAIFYYLGATRMLQHRYGEAEAVYREAIRLRPEWGEAHSNLGAALNGQQKHDQAEAACRKALELKPDLAEAYCNLGNALVHQGKPSDAEAACRRALELKPDLAEAHVNLGNALDHQEKFGQAEAAYRKALELKPNLAEAHANLGNARARQQRYVEAEAAYRKALDLRPDLAEMHNNLGYALLRQKRYGEAEAAFRKATDLNPDLALAHFQLGLALLRQARFDEAATPLKKAGDLSPVTDPLRQQARQMQQESLRFVALDARLPAILRGTDKPANADEQLALAQVCFLKEYHGAAARFFREAFAPESRFAGNAPAGFRYVAACTAALAGCGRGRDADQLGEQERARWRRQALDWLRQDLTWWGERLDPAGAEASAQVRDRLRLWQGDPDLAGVRAKDALAGLPDEERQRWERLWSDVDALLRRVSAPE
jgi:serine/threonine-protein kinase